jgi:hypothetical protein
MSIMALHRIAARLRFGMHLKGRVRAARGALEREGIVNLFALRQYQDVGETISLLLSSRRL